MRADEKARAGTERSVPAHAALYPAQWETPTLKPMW
jgi:hypothetical protein